jgi:hypothetical protein
VLQKLDCKWRYLNNSISNLHSPRIKGRRKVWYKYNKTGQKSKVMPYLE